MQVLDLVSPRNDADLSNISAQKWLASLSMTFAPRSKKTVLIDSKRQGPLGVQRAFYPDATGCAHVYVLHPPAGIVSGDTLALNAELKVASKVLVTTPGAARFYRARVAEPLASLQTQNVTLTVSDQASLEYLPMETLVYNKANALNNIKIYVEGSGQYIGWEITCLGLPNIEQAFEQGNLAQSVSLFHNKKCLFYDNMTINTTDGANNAMMNQKVALGGHHVVGNMILFDGAATSKQKVLQQDASFAAYLVSLCREAINNLEVNALIGITELQNVIIVRYLGSSSEQCRFIFAAIWKDVRPIMLDMQGIAPRIWHT
jgi:urease accessory protein